MNLLSLAPRMLAECVVPGVVERKSYRYVYIPSSPRALSSIKSSWMRMAYITLFGDLKTRSAPSLSFRVLLRPSLPPLFESVAVVRSHIENVKTFEVQSKMRSCEKLSCVLAWRRDVEKVVFAV